MRRPDGWDDWTARGVPARSFVRSARSPVTITDHRKRVSDLGPRFVAEIFDSCRGASRAIVVRGPLYAGPNLSSVVACRDAPFESPGRR